MREKLIQMQKELEENFDKIHKEIAAHQEKIENIQTQIINFSDEQKRLQGEWRLIEKLLQEISDLKLEEEPFDAE